jgi:hypothetical protein
MDAAERKLMHSSRVDEASLLIKRDAASRGMLAWPEGIGEAVVDTVRGMIGRQFTASGKDSEETQLEEKKVSDEEVEEKEIEKEGKIEAVRLPCCCLHVALYACSRDTDTLALIVFNVTMSVALKKCRSRECFI